MIYEYKDGKVYVYDKRLVEVLELKQVDDKIKALQTRKDALRNEDLIKSQETAIQAQIDILTNAKK